MSKSNEPAAWSLFSAGGVVAALFLPITMVLTGIAVPAGWLSADGLYELLSLPLARLYVFMLIFLPLFHAAHRFRYVAADLGLSRFVLPLAVLCYGGAIAGTVIALIVLIRF